MDVESIKVYNINTKFMLLKLNDIEIVTMISNGYVNVTKLCKSRNKQFKDWKILDTSIQLMDEITSTKKDDTNIIIDVSYTSNELLKGEYVSPVLLQHIAYWISSYVAIKVSILIRYYFRKLLINTETQEDIAYGELLRTYIDQVKEKYDLRVNEINQYFNEISNVIYNKLTICLLEKAEYIISKDYSDLSNTDYEDNDMSEVNMKIERLEKELEDNNQNRNTVLSIIKSNREKSDMYIASLLAHNSNYRETLIRIKYHIDNI
ncbi:MPPV-328 N1R/p28-like protein [Magpiepox virus 2]|nr:N1R/p28-like protein [Magpiepox virus]QZW33659.1 MPPV-328 N1R/p28-like protein [Magpiepox virus 2]